MINNFEKIKELLKFESDDDFYFVQILKRKKEHPELGSNSYVVKAYYIKSLDDLDFHENEMKALAGFHNARVCINLNRRSFEKMAFHTLRKVADQIMNKDYRSVRGAFNSVCGAYSQDDDKSWIIDLDGDDVKKAIPITACIHNLAPYGDKFICSLQTKNGMHLITRPFNVQEFKSIFPEIEIHKNNPTILFIP